VTSTPSRTDTGPSSSTGPGQLRQERRPAAEQHGDEVDVDLVEQACVEALPRDRGAVDADVLVAGERLGRSIALSMP
jgi:hypothetical protein